MKNKNYIEFETTSDGRTYINLYFPDTDIMTSRVKHLIYGSADYFQREDKQTKELTEASTEFKHAMRQYKLTQYNGQG